LSIRPRGPFYVYILANANRTIYTGVTNDVVLRIARHREGIGSAFTAKYGVHELVYVEEFASVMDAITREKEIKGWRRARKIALVEAVNPDWQDLGII
jgi:putative endonuclease